MTPRDVRIVDLTAQQQFAESRWRHACATPDAKQAEFVGLSPELYADMITTLFEEFLLFPTGAITTEFHVLQRDRSVSMRNSIRCTLLDRDVPVTVTYRGLRRIDELRTLLRSERILDSLAGVLLDGRYFGADLHDALAASGGAYPVAVICGDIDHFKAVNDTHGHLAGDALLSQVFRLFQEEVGTNGAAYRTGGEEITGLISGVDTQRATQIADAFRQRVESATVDYRGLVLRATISVGVAATDRVPREALRDSADTALYKAKSAGRNRVCTA